MSELMRFRLARAPQKQAVDSSANVPLHRGRIFYSHLYKPDGLFEDTIKEFLNDSSPFVEGYEINGITIIGKTTYLATRINELEQWLTFHKNRPSDEKLSMELQHIINGFDKGKSAPKPDSKNLSANAQLLIDAADENWWVDRQNVGFSLIVAMLRDQEPSLAIYLNRLMLIFGLVELAAENSDVFKTANDIYWALRYRIVILPQIIVDFLKAKRPHSLMVRRPGFSDLYVVRDEWARYEAGEIAYIENIMASETRERSHTRTTENEEIITIDEEQSNLEERDNQSTNRFDLQNETSRDSSINIGMEGSVDASAKYGAAEISTHLGGSLDYSLNESQSKATTTAHETVARAVIRAEKKIRQIRTTRSLTRIEEINKHSFKNDGADSKHISGVYRWVDKIKRVQIFRYPNRFLIEFQIPEPGAWIRWLLNQKKEPILSEKPVDLKSETEDLTPGHINGGNYLQLGARYKTLGLNPPPEDKIIATVVTRASPENPADDKEPIRFQTGQITVPEGYTATTWNATIQTWHNNNINNNDAVSLRVALGSGPQKRGVSPKNNPIEMQLRDGVVGDISEGVIPISIMADTVYGFNVNITVNCKPQPKTIQVWQIDCYGKIAQAYYAMKRQYDEEIAAQSIRGGVQIEGLSPAQNAEIIRTEIKKSVIEMLTAKDFTGRDAYQIDPQNQQRIIPPEINLQEAIKTAPEIQFLEQAFEWENLTYVLYPYFWARKDQWNELADLSRPDPDFAKFLRSGSARVVLPARPGFEQQAFLYTQLGILWGGGPTPAPYDEDYLSIAEEIHAQEKPPRDGIPGESWEVRLPTTMVWLDTENSKLPVENPKMELDEPPGKGV